MKKNTLNLILALLITITPFIILSAPLIVNYNKVSKNTYLLGEDYSRFSRDEVTQKMNNDFSVPENLNLSLDNQKYLLSLASFSASLNHQKTIDSMLYNRLDRGLIHYIKYFFIEKNFNLVFDHDKNLLAQQINSLDEQISKPFVPTELELNYGKISVITGSLGLSLDKKSLEVDILSTLSQATFDQNIEIKTNIIGSIPDQDTIDSTSQKAKTLIDKKLTLSIETSLDISVDDNTLISWLSFDNNFQENKIIDYVNSLSQSVKRDPINAIFEFEDNQVLEFQPSKEGITIKEDELKNLLMESLSALLSSEDKDININIPVNTTPPLIKNEDVNNLGIKELLGRGTSTFKHSSNIRNQNIIKGSSIINRILVTPGDTFSFIKSLGEVSLAAGYKKAYIIRQGKTELDVGGGICQVSTTFFRAMLDSGVSIIERRAHAFRVSYYEEDSKPGFDATVFIPSPDLKFINDTGNYILIQSIIDIDNRRLTYEFYGTSDGRKSEISNYKQWGYQTPPPDVWIDDPTLEPGKVVQDEHPVAGLKTAFDWIVTDKDDNIIHQKTFQSNFVPWAAVYRRGI